MEKFRASKIKEVQSKKVQNHADLLKELSIMKLFLQNKALVNILHAVFGMLTVGITSPSRSDLLSNNRLLYHDRRLSHTALLVT
jgi:hypothetical protein